MADFKRLDDQRYLNTLFGSLARQKEIPISVLYNNRQVVARLTTDSINKQKINIYPSQILPVTTEELVKISFFYKEIFFIFEAEVVETAGTYFRIHLPASVLASYRRLVERYKPKNHQEATLRLQGYNVPLSLVDVSTKGLAFRAGERLFKEGQTVRNITICFAEDLTVRLDGIIKHITQNANGEFMYGIEIISIERHDFRNLFTHIFEHTYPYFSLLEAFSGEQIYKLYEQARFLNLKPRDEEDNTFAELVENLERVKDKSLIASNLVYQKNGKLIALGSVLRIYNRTFLGKSLAMLPQVRLNPKNKTNIYIGLADYLLNHPYFESYLSYIDTDYEWHQDILTSAAQIIDDTNKFHFDNVVYFESKADLAAEDAKGRRPQSKDCLCETLDKPDQNFYDYCQNNLIPLEMECFGYSEASFKLDELSQIYQAYGFFLTRKLWRVSKGQHVVAYAVVECFSDPLSRYSHLDSCKLYLVSQQAEVAEIISAIRPDLDAFYGFYEKNAYQLILKSQSLPSRDINIPGFEFKGIMGIVLANREGLSEYKQLLLANFEYHSKYYPLTHPQMGIWYLEQMYPGTSIANIAGTVRIKEAVNYQLLEKAINIFVARNDGMRLRIVEENGIPRQYVSEHQYFKPSFVDFSGEAITEFYKWENELTSNSFDQINSNLFYFAIYKIDAQEGGFYANLHHIISDAWTIVLLGRQVVDIYDNLKKGIEYGKEKNPSYFDFILKEEEYRYSEKFEEDRKFWNEKFVSLPEFMYLKPRKYNLVNPKTSRRTFTIERDLAQNIRNFCSETKASPFAVFFSAMVVYLNRVTRMHDVVLGTPILNRSNAKEKETTGMFISTVPFRILIDAELDFMSFIQKVIKDWMLLLKHQKYPYELILKEFREKHKIAENLYDIILSYQNTKIDREGEIEYSSRWHFNGFQQESLNIHIGDRDDEGLFVVNFDFLDDFFKSDEIDRLNEHFTTLLKDAVENPRKKIKELEILSQREKRQLLFDFNDTTASYPELKTLCNLFEEQVERTPENIAVIFENKHLTYRELNEKSNQLARLLGKKGIKADSIVGITLERSLEMIVGIFGIMKSGGAYLPIDPKYPIERIDFMLEDSKAEVLLTIHQYNFKSYSQEKIIHLEDELLYQGDGSNLNIICNSRNLAYIIYTSGSTGQPKGVMIENQAIVNRLNWMQKKYPINEKDTILQKTPFTFDVSVWEIFWWSHQGSKVCLLTPGGEKDPEMMIKTIKNNRVTVMHFVPSMLNAFLDYIEANTGCLKDLVSLRQVFASGEALNIQQVERFNNLLLNNIGTKLSNLYGPTEAAVDVSYFDCLEYENNIPIGKPIDNINLLIVNEKNQLQPIGVPGELLISGVGLARGYLNRPDLTVEKFITHPFIINERAYRTGDLTKWNENGNIEYLGRMDNQIKLRGFRVELGEIEAVLLSYQDIKEVSVLLNDVRESKYLCAYIVADKELTTTELREHLLKKLPVYMIPAHFIQLEKLPLLSNGKIDRRALSKIPIRVETDTELMQPRSKNEGILQKICRDVLNINIGIMDNLIEVGADSLSLMRIQTIMFSKGLHLSFQDFYKYPTIAELAARIDEVAIENNPELNKTKITAIHKMQRIMAIRKTNEKIHHNILLTGATGFLGIHILNELVLKTEANIFCLIRAKDDTHAKNKLSELLDYYLFDHKSQIDKRIFIVNGDLGHEKFALTTTQYQQLGVKIDSIIHAAAIVKHYGDYLDFEKINVGGTKKIIDFASRFQKELNHISTTSIAEPNAVNSSKRYFTENDFNFGNQHIDNVYIHSKIEAEEEVTKAIENGLEATILRVGNLTERYIDGKFQINAKENMFHNLLKCIIEIGFVPEYLSEKELEFTPVDLCSQAIVEIVVSKKEKRPVFHIFNHNYIKLKDYLEILNHLDFHVSTLNCSYEGFIKYALLSNKKPATLNFLMEYLKQEYQYKNKVKVNIASDMTIKYLRNFGFEWPKVEMEYIAKTINFYKDLSYSIM